MKFRYVFILLIFLIFNGYSNNYIKTKNIILNYFKNKISLSCTPSAIYCDVDDNLKKGIIPSCDSVLKYFIDHYTNQLLESEINNLLQDNRTNGKIIIKNRLISGSATLRKKVPINISLSKRFSAACNSVRYKSCIKDAEIFYYDRNIFIYDSSNKIKILNSTRGLKSKIFGTVFYPYLPCGSCCSSTCPIPGKRYTIEVDDIWIKQFLINSGISCLVDNQNRDANYCKKYLNLGENTKLNKILYLSGSCSCSYEAKYSGVLVNLNMNIDKYDIYQGIGQIKYVINYLENGQSKYFNVIISKKDNDKYKIMVMDSESKIYYDVNC